MILETDRLILREMTQDDLKDLKEIIQDPEVMYAYEIEYDDILAQEWLDRQIMRYKKYGFGLWAMILKESGEMIGQSGLTMQPYRGGEVLEIGYLLKKKYWYKGYATEAAQGCKDYAFNELDADKVHCVIREDNTKSMNVAKRIGMKKVDEFFPEDYKTNYLNYLFLVEK